MDCMTGSWEGAFFTQPGIILVSDRPHLSPKRTKDIPCLTNSGGAPLTHYVSESSTQGGPYVSLLPNFFIKRIVMALTFNQLRSSKICAPVAAWQLMWMWSIRNLYGLHWPFLATREVPRHRLRWPVSDIKVYGRRSGWEIHCNIMLLCLCCSWLEDKTSCILFVWGGRTM